MKRIKEALEQARNDGVLNRSSVAGESERSKYAEQLVASVVQAPGTGANLDHLPRLELDDEVLSKNLVFRGHETDSFSMAYKMLRTQVYQKMLQNDWSTLGVTSSNAGEGKSLTSLNVAFSLARASAKPLVLLDLDLRRPSIVSKLGVQPERGVIDYLVKGVSLQDVLVKLSDNLLLMPGVESIKDASEILGSASMVKLLKDLRALFPDSLIIFDLPPVLVVDDVMALSPLLDTCLLVAEEGRTKQHDLEQALDLLQMTNLMGIVLNRSGEIEKSYYYSSY